VEGIDEGHEEEANPKSEYRNPKQGRGKQKSKCRMQNDNVNSKKGCAVRDGGFFRPAGAWGKEEEGRRGARFSGADATRLEDCRPFGPSC
jgi:hypothetical protein